MLKKDRVNLKRNSSVFFMGFLVISMAGLMFFLSSSFFIEEKLAVLNTDINKEQSLTGNGKLTINSWLYDKEKNEMEVTIVTKDIKTIDNDITFEAFQRNGNSQNLEVKNVFNEDGIYVLKIFGLSNEFQQVAVDVIKETENEFADIEEFSEEEEEEKTEELLVTLYSDQRVVEHKNIKVKTESEYVLYLSDVLISETERQFNEAKNEIRKEQKRQKELVKEIALNEEKMVYQTEEEKLETESIINGYQMRIEDSNQKIKEIEAREQLLQDKKEKLEQRKREIKLTFNN